jgi:hypothetical protein
MYRISIRAAIGWALLSIYVFSMASAARGAGINDTGITSCYTDTTVGATGATGVASDGGGFPRQDCRYGRDAAQAAGKLNKTGAGSKGFDFTRIDRDGNVLAPGVTTNWTCTRDNVTGLIWEIKSTQGLRSQSYTYKWYKFDTAANGGEAGFASTTADTNVLCETAGRCDTEKFVQDVNAQGLCGKADWRIPTRHELGSLLDYSRTSPTIIDNIDYFPNTLATDYWTDTPDARYSGFAYQIDFNRGLTTSIAKGLAGGVRLVRSAAP